MTLRESLTGMMESWARLGHPAPLERFVLRHGKAFTPGKRVGRKGKAGLCFMNAAKAVFKHEFAENPPTYVEGYVTSKKMGFFPIHHAWVTFDGKTAMDPTLNADDYEYFGVEIGTAALRTELVRNKVYGIFDTGYGMNTKWMFKFDPELEGIVRDVKPDPLMKKMMERTNA